MHDLAVVAQRHAVVIVFLQLYNCEGPRKGPSSSYGTVSVDVVVNIQCIVQQCIHTMYVLQYNVLYKVADVWCFLVVLRYF